MLRALLFGVMVAVFPCSAMAGTVALKCLIVPEAEGADANPEPLSLVIDQASGGVTLNPVIYRDSWKLVSSTEQRLVLAVDRTGPTGGAATKDTGDRPSEIVINIDRYTGLFRMAAVKRPFTVPFKGECLAATRRF